MKILLFQLKRNDKFKPAFDRFGFLAYPNSCSYLITSIQYSHRFIRMRRHQWEQSYIAL